MLINRLIDLLASDDPAVVPRFDNPLMLKHCELLLELVAEFFVCVAIGKEDARQDHAPSGAGA